MKKESTLGARIKEAREAARLTLEQVGEAFDISPQAVQQWEKDVTKPGTQRLGKLAVVLKCNIGWLIGNQGAKEQSKNIELVSPGDLGGRTVPRIDVTDAFDYTNGKITGKSFVQTTFPCSERSFQILLKDNSNSPLYDRGDAVVIDPSIMPPEPGDMVLALVGTEPEPVFREYRLASGKSAPKVVLHPLNPLWDDKEIDPQDSLEILGVKSEHTKRRK